MMFHAIWGIVAAQLLGATEALDTFSYRDSATARQVWVASEHTPPVETTPDAERSVLELPIPFARQPKLSRSVIDRRVKLDLSEVGGFTLELACPAPEAVSGLNLYFHSGNGWYSGANSLAAKKWQKLSFSKASFRIEDRPTGWDQIDGIRIAVWRGQPKDTTVRIRDLSSFRHEVALVIPAAAHGLARDETHAALEAADRMARFLQELGLGSDAIDERSLCHGALGNRSVAILAHNPALSDEAIAVLEKFVARGGHVLACYSLPPRLTKLLGLRFVRYSKPKTPGHYAEMRFDAPEVAGLPKSVHQMSWNIDVAAPVAYHARVIGTWFDAQGHATGDAALVLSDRGAYLSHILLSDDAEGKEQLLAALLGHFSPELWKPMAQAAIERAGRVGSAGDFVEASAAIKAPGHVAAERSLQAAHVAYEAARRELSQRAYLPAIDEARKAHALLVDAYLRAAPSPAREGRAGWNHSGTGAYPGDWERSARALSAAGFNMIVPNMLWAGRAYYPSAVLPGSATCVEYGDQIAQCVAAAHRHGLEVHVWKVNFNLSNAPKEFVEQLRRQKRTIVSRQGQPQDWLCPSHPDNFQLELDSMLEVARKYDVDGLHFDYIRYPGPDFCYCDGCRQRFEAASGRRVARWPADCVSGSRHDEFQDWRCAQVTRLVAAVHCEAKKIRPGIKISAAVFGAYPACREGVGQDWVAWVKAGYLDFVCPMDYSDSDLHFASLVENQMRLIGGRIPLYPGIGATATHVALSADRVVGQIEIARHLGAKGFTIFNFSAETAQSIVPGVGLGAGSAPAVPPHRAAEPTR
jgi:uncharacterized lipoprotein YddW (UPF0748 family)